MEWAYTHGSDLIYGLRDPLVGEIFYVGQTRDPRSRLQGHLAEARSAEKAARILAILRAGRLPSLEILQEISNVRRWPEGFAASQEAKWIKHFGAQLVNVKRIEIPADLKDFTRVF